MKQFFRHYFLPHHSNNHRSKLLQYDSMFLFAVIFLFATFIITSVKRTHPQVLGTTINLEAQDILKLTNQERQKNGVGLLVMNDALTHAAQLKANDMFAQNYWAHNSPTGKMPWDFIKAAGYDYVYAGENLARGFDSAQDVVNAWMNSPSHRENMLSPNYRDVGFAIEQGNLTGEKDTILIVEELGNTTTTIPQVSTNRTLGSAKIPAVAIQQKPLFDTRLFTKNIALMIVFVFIIVLFIDLILIKQKKVVRFVGHNLDHIMFLGTVGIVVLLLQLGTIL